MANPSTHDSTQAAPGVRAGSQARQPGDRQIPGGRSADVAERATGVTLEDVRVWIKQNQTLAVSAAFAFGLFMGVNMRR